MSSKPRIGETISARLSGGALVKLLSATTFHTKPRASVTLNGS